MKGNNMKERQLALQTLSSILNKGDTIYYNVRHVSRSGMSRNIQFFWIDADRRPARITWLMSELLGYKHNDDGTIKVRGCGMDMGFHVISQLSVDIFGDYKSLKSEVL